MSPRAPSRVPSSSSPVLPVARHEARARLSATAPFALGQSVEFLRQFSPMAGEYMLGARGFTKALRIDGETLVAEVTAADDPDDSSTVHVRLASAHPLPPARLAAALDRLRFMLSLDDDLRDFYAIAAEDAAFAPIARQLHGLHQVKFPTPFENAAWALLTQRTPMPVARRLKQAIIELAGTTMEWPGEWTGVRWSAFPEPADLLAVDPELLRAAVGAGPRAERLLGVAAGFAQVDEHFLRTAPYATVDAWLRALPGIGPWSATFILLRGLGRMEQLPVGEARLGEAAARVYGRALDARELARIASRYGAAQGYWAHYLRVLG